MSEVWRGAVAAATALEVGFALEDASGAVVNNVTTGASALFPLGLLHYQQNRDCQVPLYAGALFNYLGTAACRTRLSTPLSISVHL